MTKMFYLGEIHLDLSLIWCLSYKYKTILINGEEFSCYELEDYNQLVKAWQEYRFIEDVNNDR